VLVGGVEKMTGASPERTLAANFAAMDNEKDGRCGLTFPAFFALCMQRHMYEFGTTRRQIGLVSVQNRANGSLNPICTYRTKTTLEEVIDSRLLADPLHLLDSCNRADGAVAVVLCPLSRAREFTSELVRILACTQSIGTPSISDTKTLTEFRATVVAAKKAYDQAGLGPDDIDVAEVHDCTTITEIIDVEDLGFVDKGAGGPAIEEGMFSLDGRLPVNPSGGLLSRGHPFGATGLAQIYEIVQQLRGRAVNQVQAPKVGLAQNIGGTGATGTVTILGR
jgi:acetyl-CoA C-acetyltransferase